MAAIEIIEGDDYINVEDKVGKSGLNGWSDVVTVQAFLKFIEEQLVGTPSAVFAPGEVPEPNGSPTPDLPDLILKYQKNANKGGPKYRLKEDGIVGRARGKTRWAAGKVWTITEINDRCRIISLAKAGSGALSGDHIKDLFDRFPVLRIAVGTPGVTF